MICYLEFCLIFSSIIYVQVIRLFNDLPSEDLKRNFDSFPLVSRTVQEIDWCKVSQSVTVESEVGDDMSGCGWDRRGEGGGGGAVQQGQHLPAYRQQAGDGQQQPGCGVITNYFAGVCNPHNKVWVIFLTADRQAETFLAFRWSLKSDGGLVVSILPDRWNSSWPFLSFVKNLSIIKVLFILSIYFVTVRWYSGETREEKSQSAFIGNLHCRPLLNCFEQSDEKLIDMVRKEILVHPDWSRGYNLSKPLEEVLQDQSEDTINLALEMDQELFKGKLYNGFFIEAGASTGKTV